MVLHWCIVLAFNGKPSITINKVDSVVFGVILLRKEQTNKQTG